MTDEIIDKLNDQIESIVKEIQSNEMKNQILRSKLETFYEVKDKLEHLND